MKKYSRFLSILVLLAITAGCIPFSAFAEEPLITPDTIEDTKIVEVVERREESIKHFRLPDGSYEAVSYAGAVHRKDANGVWQDIDNDLTLKTVGTKQLYTTDDSRLSFAKDYSSGSELVSINENGYVISMSMLQRQDEAISTAPMTSTVVNSNYARPHSFDTMEEAINIENKSSIAYSNVNSNTDIEYIMQGNDLKENIIVKSKGERYEYGFQLALVGLDATLDESGAIYLCDKESEEIKYIIPAPYMYDAEGEYSEAVSYSLFNVEGDKYLLVVTADPQWVNDSQTDAPVSLNSGIKISYGSYDTFIDSSEPSTNYGNITQVWVNSQRSALINFNLPVLDDGQNAGIVTDATLFFNYYAMANYGETTFSAHKITSSWSENSVTYNTKPSMSGELHSKTITTVSGVHYDNPMTGSMDVINIVKDHYERGTTFYGIALQQKSGKYFIIVSSEQDADSTYLRIFYETLDISEKIYYIASPTYASNYPIQIDNDDAQNSYRSSNADIEIRQSSEGLHEAWQFVYYMGGTYKILSVNSDLALSVVPQAVNSSTTALQQREFTGASTQLWRISLSSSGNYVLRPDSAKLYSTDWCMAIGTALNNVTPICQKAYANNTDYTDEWDLLYLGVASGRVRMEGQQTPFWCWVTASRMFAMNYGVVSEQKNQEAAVRYVFPDITEQEELEKKTGSILNARSAINYYSGYAADYNGFAQYYFHQICSEQTLVNFLNAGHVIYISRGYYSEDATKPTGYSRTGGHSTLIYGYVTIDSDIWFLIRDPGPEDVGSTDLMSYEKIYNGRECRESELSDIGVWDGFIVKSNININYTTIAPDSRFIES